MPFRCSDARAGEWIDRSREVRFRFEGRTYKAHPGDTIASALLANGVSLMGRSFKYHRPRGVVSMANHDINALFASAGDTNIRGDITPVEDGMELQPVNVRDGLEKDRDRYLDWFGRFMPVGFYYKAFHRPRFLFPFFERLIRRRAGLGRVDLGWPARRRPKRYGHCDVLVVGAGPAGMTAACDAARRGFEVILVDENPFPGGTLGYQWSGDAEVLQWRRRLLDEVEAHPKITLITSSVVLGYYDDHWLPVSTPDGILKVRARGVVVAAGLIEQPAVFRNNDRPGVLMASAAQRLLEHFGVLPCATAVVLAANPEAYAAARQLHSAGVQIRGIAACGDSGREGEDAAALTSEGVPIWPATTINEVHGTNAVTGVSLTGTGGETAAPARIDCDGVIVSTGWAPAAHLLYQAGGRLRYDDSLEMQVPHEWPDTVVPAGRLNGAFTLDQQRDDALEAVRCLVSAMEGEPDPGGRTLFRDTVAHGAAWPVSRHPRGRNFVDFDEDLQLKDLEQAAREGFDNIELLKRYSTVGMGPSQGKHANLNAIRILARYMGQGMDATGTTTARPMYHPVRLEDLAGRRFRPTRLSPLHERHRALGAEFMEAGEWLRVAHYGGQEAPSEAIADEVRAVRRSLGLIDVSTLGKIEVVGPDAARLLEGSYTMRMGNMKTGMTRYGLIVDESGVIEDDGVVARLADDRFYLSATSGHAAATYRMLQRHVLEWGLNVHVINRTGQLGAVNLAGPQSRRVLESLVDTPLDEDAFPNLGARESRIDGVPVRLLRVGFVGELAYEIHAPASALGGIWDALMEAGSGVDIQPFGVEAQRILRLEKGHIIVGQDTDGLTTPFNTGMPWAVHLKKPFFRGRPALAHLKGRESQQLVAFALPPESPLPRECHLVIEDGDIAGRVTSIANSPILGHPIGLAMVERGLAERETPLQIRIDEGRMVSARRMETPFYDPEGNRQFAGYRDSSEESHQ